MSEMVERKIAVELVAALEQAEAFLQRMTDAVRGAGEELTPLQIQTSMNAIFQMSANALAGGREALRGGTDGWQQIATAPEDTDILTWTPRENHRIGVICGLHVGCFRTDLMCWHLSDDEFELAPTHWQPLPAPPAALHGERV